MSTADRHFILARQGFNIAIREITGGSDVTFTRNEAWTLAQKMAKPAKAAKDPRAKAANGIEFINLDGMTTVVQTAGQTQEAYEAELRGERPAPVAKVETAPVAPAAVEPAEYEWLRAQDTRENDFLASLKSQLESKGKLTEKQTVCITKAMAPKAERQAPKADVPAGHYAVDGEDGALKFYRLDTPTEGKWAGYTFLKVQAGDDYFPVKGAAKHAILAKIAVDPKAATIRYGHELGKCGVCNRTLTDEASREAGIGPVCAEKF